MKAVLLALLLDAAIGDPRGLPHPVRAIGRMAAACETFFRKALPGSPKTAGALCLAAVAATTWAAAAGLILLAATAARSWGRTAAGAVIVYYAIALRDLVSHGLAVKKALDRDDLELARKKVAMMVSRDTAAMDREAVIRATVESLAENLVDGVTAPLMFALAAGPAAAALYRAVNTCDAIFGYKNEKYRDFGFFPAKTDDLFNLIPARLTGIFIIAAAAVCGARPLQAARILFRDRKKHESPNGGHPEAAVAGALGIRLGGPGIYFGKTVEKPTLGDPIRPPEPSDISRACLITTTAALLLTAAAMAAVWWLV